MEQWRDEVARELRAQKVPLPVDLVLAVIQVESGGSPGLVNAKSGASGLTQVMPNTLKWFNEFHADEITLDQLRSKHYGPQQIKVGIWVLGQFWRGAYRYMRNRLGEIPTEELARIADLFYVAGPGATKRRLNKIDPPFFDVVEARYPKWNALPHPRNVFRLAGDLNWNLPALSEWLEGEVTRERKKQGAAVLVIAAAIVLYWVFFKKGKRNGQKD